MLVSMTSDGRVEFIMGTPKTLMHEALSHWTTLCGLAGSMQELEGDRRRYRGAHIVRHLRVGRWDFEVGSSKLPSASLRMP